jgi:hypothetical protein
MKALRDTRCKNAGQLEVPLVVVVLKNTDIFVGYVIALLSSE